MVWRRVVARVVVVVGSVVVVALVVVCWCSSPNPYVKAAVLRLFRADTEDDLKAVLCRSYMAIWVVFAILELRTCVIRVRLSVVYQSILTKLTCKLTDMGYFEQILRVLGCRGLG